MTEGSVQNLRTGGPEIFKGHLFWPRTKGVRVLSNLLCGQGARNDFDRFDRLEGGPVFFCIKHDNKLSL